MIGLIPKRLGAKEKELEVIYLSLSLRQRCIDHLDELQSNGR
jgi:hypothetical protein